MLRYILQQTTAEKDAATVGGAARWRSDALMHTVVQLTSMAKRAISRDAGKERKVRKSLARAKTF